MEEENEEWTEQEKGLMSNVLMSGLSRTAIKGDYEKEEEEEEEEVQNSLPGPRAKKKVPVTKPKLTQAQVNSYVRRTQKHKDKVDKTMETENKQRCINTINKYHRYFPQLQDSSSKKKWTVRQSLDELKQEISRCQHELAADSALEDVMSAEIIFNGGIEWILTSMGIDVGGLAIEAKSSQDIVMDELKELSIKYEDFFASGPEWRYMVKFMRRIYLVHQMNTSMTANMYASPGVSPEHSKMYADL